MEEIKQYYKTTHNILWISMLILTIIQILSWTGSFDFIMGLIGSLFYAVTAAFIYLMIKTKRVIKNYGCKKENKRAT